MKVSETKLDHMSKVCRRIIASNKKFEVARNDMGNLDLSQKRRNALRNKMETEAEYIEDQMHELHCCAVELGVADYDESRYGDKEISSANGWSSLKKNRRKPKI